MLGYDGILIQLVQASDDGIGRCDEYHNDQQYVFVHCFLIANVTNVKIGIIWRGKRVTFGGRANDVHGLRLRFLLQSGTYCYLELWQQTISGDDIVPYTLGRTSTSVSIYLVTVEGKNKRSPDFNATSYFCGRFVMISDDMVLKPEHGQWESLRENTWPTRCSSLDNADWI